MRTERSIAFIATAFVILWSLYICGIGFLIWAAIHLMRKYW